MNRHAARAWRQGMGLAQSRRLRSRAFSTTAAASTFRPCSKAGRSRFLQHDRRRPQRPLWRIPNTALGEGRRR
jgi:hypothetical protein